MAAGRFNAWWAAAAMAGLADDWPVNPDELGEAVQALEWFLWDTGEPPLGWSFRLAVVDPDEGIAWATIANDQRM